MEEYVAYRKSIFISVSTIKKEEFFLYRFLVFLNDNSIMSVDRIDRALINKFSNQLGFYSICTRHNYCVTIKMYFTYLYDNELVEEDLSRHVLKIHYPSQSKLPLTYTKEEIERLFKAVDRSSPKGKRDYAMILLAARLGLRSSDIYQLKFENIHWELNQIILTQQKTGKKIELPLLQEVGDAIIDYMKYGRPISDLPQIFLYASPPYDRVGEDILHSIVGTYIKIAKIEHIKGRGQGPHALRHSLASILLEKKTPLHVISEVLGHKNTESTRHYLRIDIASLRLCALDVPIIQVKSDINTITKE